MGYLQKDGGVAKGGMQLIRLELVDFETPRHLLYARIEVLPTLGNLWQVDNNQLLPTVRIDRGDGRTRPLVTNTDWLVFYEPVDLGQPDVYRYNDDGELVLVDTRQDLFMARISDVEFLPPERIDPDNPPPWISTEYILRPAWLPLALNHTVSLQQGTSATLHLRAMHLDMSIQSPLLLALNTDDTRHGGAVIQGVGDLWMVEKQGCNVSTSASITSTSAACCTRVDCGRVNLCSDCSEQCRLQEVLTKLSYNTPPVCRAPSSSASSSFSPSIASNLQSELKPYENICAYLFDGLVPSSATPTVDAPQCRSQGTRFPANSSSSSSSSSTLSSTPRLEELIVAVNVTEAFESSQGTVTFDVTRVGQETSDRIHPLSTRSLEATLTIETHPVNRAPQIHKDNHQNLNTVRTSASAAPTTRAVLEASDADKDQVMYSVAEFPSHATLHLPSEGDFVGPIVQEQAHILHQWPGKTRCIQGPDAVPAAARRLR